MAEFGDKLHTAGGKVEFLHDANGLATRISGTSVKFRAMYQIAVGFDGRILAVVPPTGIGAPLPPYPKPSMLAWIQSDEQGMWGRRCPNCKSYFRSNHIMGATCCPYCFRTADSTAFITEAQGRYVTAFCEGMMTAWNEKKNVTLDLEAVTDVTPEWHYSEVKQQFHFECKVCNTKVDILGDYGACPQCTHSNAREIMTTKLNELDAQWQQSDADLTDQKSRGEQWEKLTIGSVSALEDLGNHLRKILLPSPYMPKRRQDLENLSFQRLFDTAESLRWWFGIDVLKGVPEDDQTFLRKMFQRRHILIHNGGKVDDAYLEFSGDTTVRLHERIRIRSNEARRIIQLTAILADNLLTDFESMT
jgi:hypothetical protein